jgi:hypothetical protein
VSLPLLGEICLCSPDVILNALLLADLAGDGIELLIEK